MSEKYRLLAIDDNSMNLLVLHEALGDSYEIETAANGIEGLALARASRPGVILLDVMMPGLDGYEVCRRIKRCMDLRSCRVIMVSALTALQDRLLGYDAGADDFVSKPFNEDELRTKIEFAIRARRLELSCGAVGDVLAFISALRDFGIITDLRLTRAYAGVLAEELASGPYQDQVDFRFLDDMHYASILCDVGQLAVPTAVREKSDPLTAEEAEQMKQHTLIGARLMNRFASDNPDITLFRMASDLARSHHENFDGTGYPDGLHGNEIPLEARIVRLAEEFELLTGERAGNFRVEPTVARDEIIHGRETVFDPVIVNAFLHVFDEFAQLCRTDISLHDIELIR